MSRKEVAHALVTERRVGGKPVIYGGEMERVIRRRYSVNTMLVRLQLALLTGLALVRIRATTIWRRYPAAREGQSFLEYALVLAVIAVIVLISAQALGLDLAAVFNRIRNRLGSLG